MIQTQLLSTDEVTVRPARDDDAAAVIALVAAAYAEYPGCVFDLEGELPELKVPSSSHAAMGGDFWVAEAAGQVVGSVGYRPLQNGSVELLKLYVAKAARGQGLGRRLIALVDAVARAACAARIELWTDTRFTAAHRLYEHL
ncbi:MAG: GNAT family N-acetyltransferase, partial [Kiloniellales bacterium]